MIKIYTDGSCLKNGVSNVLAGWSYVVVENGKLITTNCGTIENGTNNIGELIAIKRALEYIARHPVKENFYNILSDSAYCINGILDWRYNWKENNWTRKGKELKNKQIWIEIDEILSNLPCAMKGGTIFTHIKGHTGNKWNELADKLAKGAINGEA